jgi:hypothetical protein
VDGRIGRIGRAEGSAGCSRLQYMYYCNFMWIVCYISVDYRTEKLVHSIIVVQIHINISIYIYIYYSVVHHVRILHKSISGTRTQPLCFHDSDEENCEGEMVGRLRRPERLTG